MPLDYDLVMGMPPIECDQDLTVRDTMLYALGVGVGADDPLDRVELKYVYEDGLAALPTMATVMAYPGFWAKDPKYRLDWKRILHGEQSVELHGALPVAGKLHGVTTIDAIYDKGADKGALICSTRRISDRASGALLATVRQTTFARGDGGFGGSPDGSPKPHELPDRAPDETVHAAIHKSQALIYRLSGDYNPLHVDPDVAREGGFSVPIFHGLGTYGVVGRALVRALTGDRPETVRRFDARFSSPVYPGDALAIDVWRESAASFGFRARIPARNVVALQNGRMEIVH